MGDAMTATTSRAGVTAIAAGAGRRWNVLGDHQTVKLTGRETGGTLTVIEQSLEPGIAVPTHVHEREDETFYVLAGAMLYESEGKQIRAAAGDTVWAPRGIPHRWEALGPGTTRVLMMMTPSGIEGMFEALAALPPGPPDFAKVAEICGRFGVRFVG